MEEIDVSPIRKEINAILTAPDVDLQTISAKQVRKMLGERFPSLDVKQHRELLKKEIITAFQKLHGVEADTENESVAHSQLPQVEYNKESIPSTSTKKVPKEQSSEVSDSEYARQLNVELNGRSMRRTRNSSSSNVKTPLKKGGGKKKGVKSSEIVDTSGDEDRATTQIKAKKTKRASTSTEGEKKKGGFHKAYKLSPALSNVVGEDTMSRPQVVKKLWEYIRAHDLQMPSDRRKIRCDETLKGLFDRETVDSFKMNKFLSSHLWSEE